MPSDDPPADSRSRAELARVFSELQAAAETRKWDTAAKLAAEHDRLLRIMVATREPEAIAYLETVRDEHRRLLDLIASDRDKLRDDIKLVGKGRKAVAAYR